MTPQELEQRQHRATAETFIISKEGTGFRVYSPTGSRQFYLVGGSLDAPACSCPDFARHQGDAAWRCKHILAVVARMGAPSTGSGATDPETAEERRAIQEEGALSDAGRFPPVVDSPSQMVLKRSVSPDGKIDSLSVELTCPLVDADEEEILARADHALRLSATVVGGFLNGNGHGASVPEPKADTTNGSVPAKVIGIAGMNTRFGHRLFLNVQVNGQTLKFFGDAKKLAEALQAVGYQTLPEKIQEGLRLNLPCLVVTRPSEDGRFVNVEQMFSTNGRPREARVRG